MDYEITITRVGMLGIGGVATMETLEAVQTRLEANPIAGMKRVWIEGDELLALMEPIHLKLPVPFASLPPESKGS